MKNCNYERAPALYLSFAIKQSITGPIWLTVVQPHERRFQPIINRNVSVCNNMKRIVTTRHIWIFRHCGRLLLLTATGINMKWQNYKITTPLCSAKVLRFNRQAARPINILAEVEWFWFALCPLQLRFTCVILQFNTGKVSRRIRWS